MSAKRSKLLRRYASSVGITDAEEAIRLYKALKKNRHLYNIGEIKQELEEKRERVLRS